MIPLFLTYSSIFLLVGLLAILGLILWISALVDITRNTKGSNSSFLIWILIIFFFPIAGSIIYFLVGKKSIAGRRAFNPNFHTKG